MPCHPILYDDKKNQIQFLSVPMMKTNTNINDTLVRIVRISILDILRKECEMRSNADLLDR